LALVAVGLAAGLLGALALTRLIASQLWGVTPTDPVTFAAVVTVLLGVAAISSLVPALRVLKLDPALTLRAE
jgi:putative ABC transport system permease protein